MSNEIYCPQKQSNITMTVISKSNNDGLSLINLQN